MQVQIIIGAADGDHLILPRSFMHVNSRAGTLKLQLAHQQNSAEKAPVIMYVQRFLHAVCTCVASTLCNCQRMVDHAACAYCSMVLLLYLACMHAFAHA